MDLGLEELRLVGWGLTSLDTWFMVVLSGLQDMKEEKMVCGEVFNLLLT